MRVPTCFDQLYRHLQAIPTTQNWKSQLLTILRSQIEISVLLLHSAHQLKSPSNNQHMHTRNKLQKQ